MSVIKAYAGIGSRTITSEERDAIQKVANHLSGLYLYSGHADGADKAFEEASPDDKTVLWTPWNNFAGPTTAKYVYMTGDSEKGLASVDEFHPGAKYLKFGSRALMARNYHQIAGMPPKWPEVSFVVFCADQAPDGRVRGGTGQAIRIADAWNIPSFNLRRKSVDEVLREIEYLL